MRPKTIIIVGAGVGGLSAAVRLAQQGHSVQVLESRPAAGGLASGTELEGFCFDLGPYILLDYPGLDWVFQQLGLDLAARVPMRRVEAVYQVAAKGSPPVCFYDSLERTAEEFEGRWPGSGIHYRRFIAALGQLYHGLQPLQRTSHPGITDLLRAGAWRAVPFLLRSLKSVLDRSRLPGPVRDGLAIWTHVAGQDPAAAPSPLAFVPAVIHRYGAYSPIKGIAEIGDVLEQEARASGVQFCFNAVAAKIRCHGRRVQGVETADGQLFPADRILSNAHGVGTYLELIEAIPNSARRRLARLPLQSPGVCAYLAARGNISPPYLRFDLPGGERLCRLLVAPAVVHTEVVRDGWQPLRLIAPMSHEEANRLGASGQKEYLAEVLEEPWWREGIEQHRVLATRVPAQWGEEFHLYRDSMNPVMTARFMRSGRLAHRSPYVRGLYLAGSSTHPGQWVSFSAISGILAADLLHGDMD